MKILNSRETKNILEKLEEQYGYNATRTELEYIMLMNKDNRIYLVSRNIERLPYDKLKIDSIGMYFGELYKESLRLSIEGSQMIGPESTKNVVELNHEQMIEWIKGVDLEFEDTGRHFVITKYTNTDGRQDFLGCGKYKDGKLMNFVSKSRRLIVVNN
jgi:NOL1/NOP2/fmu family ribosome biogenesis protein